MRDTHEGMIELLDASHTDNVYSAVIRHKIADKVLKLRFAIDISDYGRLKHILQFRPFENTGLAPYRYFFPLSYRKDIENQEIAHIAVRVEQLDRHKQYEFETSIKFVSNLLWFNSLADTKPIEQMIQQ
jgi:hypothetical protein